VPVGNSWEGHKAVLEARQPFADFVYRRVDSQGDTRYISASGQPVFDAKKRFKGYRGIGKDITASGARRAAAATGARGRPLSLRGGQRIRGAESGDSRRMRNAELGVRPVLQLGRQGRSAGLQRILARAGNRPGESSSKNRAC